MGKLTNVLLIVPILISYDVFFKSQLPEKLTDIIHNKHTQNRVRRQVESDDTSCQDVYDTCDQFVQYCSEFEQYKENCRETCGACSAGFTNVVDVDANKIINGEPGNEDAAGEVEIQPIEIKPLTLETPDESNALAGKEKSEEFEICKDRMDCSVMKTFCDNPNFQSTRYYCRLTCNACNEDIEDPTKNSTDPLLTAGALDDVETCVDRRDYCQDNVAYCMIERYKDKFALDCPKTCKFCTPKSEQTETTVAPIEVEISTSCEDKIPSACAYSILHCDQEVYRKNCPLSCGVCKLPDDYIPPEKPCRDMTQSCTKMSDFCEDEMYTENMRMMCPVTCGFECMTNEELARKYNVAVTQLPPTTPPLYMNVAPATPQPAFEGECKDHQASCTHMAALCKKPSYSKLLTICPVTCGTCTPEQIAGEEPPVCDDVGAGCPKVAHLCSDANAESVRKNCPKTCGICDGTPVEITEYECKDSPNICPGYESFCDKSNVLKKMCPVTCNSCPDKPHPTIVSSVPITSTTEVPTTVTTTTAVEETSQEICEDLKPNMCQRYYKAKCKNPAAQAFVSLNCRQTCGFCSDSTVTENETPVAESSETETAAPVCKNLKPNLCSRYGKGKCNGPLKKFMSVNCKQTCNLCGGAKTPQTSVSADSGTCSDATPKMCKIRGKKKCGFKAYAKMMNDKCKKTCGKCDGAETTSSSCDDTGGSLCTSTPVSKCKAAGKVGILMRQKCKKTCGKCSSSSSPAKAQSSSSTCEDTGGSFCTSTPVEKCSAMGKLGIQMREKCKKTCGKCGRKKRDTKDTLF